MPEYYIEIIPSISSVIPNLHFLLSKCLLFFFFFVVLVCLFVVVLFLGGREVFNCIL